MKLDFIDLTDLKLSPINVRKNGMRNGDDLVPSIRSIGVVQPLLVRKNCEGYEIVAGQRRFDACQKLAKEQAIEPIPCAIMEDGDDAKAIEASLAENIARLPMDEIDQYKAFSALLKQGKDLEDIAASFGVTERLVKQRLAIANLYNPILNAYRREEVRAQDVRTLTMATTKQQRAWWALFKEDNAPTGYALKHWLFDGAQIPASNALFDLEGYDGVIISDLFGEDRYFADESQFWECQSKMIAEAVAEYRDDGWQDVIIMDVGRQFCSWEHVQSSKEDGGRVYVACSSTGEVTFFEGYITHKEHKAKLRAESQGADKPQRPETTKAMDNYLALHKHAAVRAALLKKQGTALRLAVAQIIAGSSLWYVRAEPQKAAKDCTAESIGACETQMVFEEHRKTVLELLGMDADTIIADYGIDTMEVFEKLGILDDAVVMNILTFVVTESLPVSSDMIEHLGQSFEIDMATSWSADDAFFDLLKDKQAINAMVREVAGNNAADANITATGKVQKDVIKQALNGERTSKVENWIPRYLAFPRADYLSKDR